MAHPTGFEPVTFGSGRQRSRYAASRGMVLSTNRKNRVLRALDLNLRGSGAVPRWALDKAEAFRAN